MIPSVVQDGCAPVQCVPSAVPIPANQEIQAGTASWQPGQHAWSCVLPYPGHHLPIHEGYLQLGPVSRPPTHSLCYTYLLFRLHKAGLAKYKEFGPVVREEVLPGVNVVWLFHPEVRIAL